MSLREYTNSKNWKMLWHLLWVTLIVVIYNLYRYYHEKTGVVCPDKSCSNRVSLEDLCSDNEAAIKLIDNFDLEEVFPF